MRCDGEQITCNCNAYNFPHRLTSGKCNGQAWINTYFYNDRRECDGCISNQGTHCEIGQGQEDLKHCPLLEGLK